MRPWQVLLFVLGVIGVLAVLGAALPKEGLLVAGDLRLRFPSPGDVLFPEQEEKVDISEILSLETDPAAVADVDTLAVDTVTTAVEETPFTFDPSRLAPLEERIALHYPRGDKTVLHTLFTSLEQARSGNRPLRIMHYGDSQLEGDRITAYLRNKIQSQFGGTGPGLLAVADIVPSFSVDRVISDNWIRYSVMDRKAPDLDHTRFGAMSSFSRFTPILPDTLAPDTSVSTATITLKPLKRAYGKAQVYGTCRLFFGWHRAPVTITVSADGAVIATETVDPADRLLVRTWKFPPTPQELTLTFSGADSPDIFGISLESSSGTAVDNIAARGAAGYELRRGDQGLQKAMFTELDVELLILQYGGNVLPNIKDSAEVAQYGRFFGGQIARFKKMLPGVSIIVIGPSDMSIKDGEHYVTRPYLEGVRDAMKANTLAQGAVFWDMYEAMGGRNSMVSWVEADPPLAAADYTHFSPQGARKVGELFYTALINDFATYHAASEKRVAKSPKEKKDVAPALP